MKILLDECLPRPLKFDFAGHEIFTVTEMKWSGIRNGELLALAVNAGFEVFVTADQNLKYQQNLRNYRIGIVVLIARSNKIEDLQELVPEALEAIRSITPGKFINIGA